MTTVAATTRVALANFRDVDAERFSRLVRDSAGFCTVWLDELAHELRDVRLPPATACVALHAEDVHQAREALLRTRKATDLPVLLLATEAVVQEALASGLTFDDALAPEAPETTLRSRLLAMARIAETRSIAVQIQRLADIGTLLASVTHELNNPLSYVRSNVAVALGDIASLRARSEAGRSPGLMASLSELQDMLAETQVGVERVIRIVADLRLVARAGDEKLQPTSLVAGVESALNLLKGQMPHDVRIVRRLGSVRDVQAEPGRLVQVLVNLITNARDALTGRGGTIELRTTERGNAGIVEVIDDGPGMPPEVLGRAFDPFFTTKPPGAGTGLGLSISRQIVQAFGGEISIESEPGRGAAVRVAIPLAAGRA